MGREHQLKVDDHYFDQLAKHVHGMIADLQDGIGMANSKDGVIGHEALAEKVDAFEKHWHGQAKPNLITHLQGLHKHIEKTRSDIEALEKQLAQAAKKAAQPSTPTQLPPRTPVTTPTGGGGDGGDKGGGGQKHQKSTPAPTIPPRHIGIPGQTDPGDPFYQPPID